MRTSQEGKDLIKRWEGFSPIPYLCPANILTIGYGHTGKDVVKGMNITEAEGEELLARDLARFEAGVHRLITHPLSQSQFDALVSFSYNLGLGALQASTLRKVINRGEVDTASSQFGRWVFAGGKKLKGLVLRRQEEAALFSREDIDNEESTPLVFAYAILHNRRYPVMAA